MAAAIDEAGIQFRILNASKGPAVRATRAQASRDLYKQAIRKRLENQDHLHIFQQVVEDILLDKNKIIGVGTQGGLKFEARAIVLTTAISLARKIHVCLENYPGEECACC